MLPETITTQTVRETADTVDESYIEAFEDDMCDYMEEIVSILAKKHSLNETQIEELFDRLCWNLELLPKSN